MEGGGRRPVMAWSPDHATPPTAGLQKGRRPAVGAVARSGDRAITEVHGKTGAHKGQAFRPFTHHSPNRHISASGVSGREPAWSPERWPRGGPPLSRKPPCRRGPGAARGPRSSAP